MAPRSSNTFAQIASQYCSDVLAGRIPACQWVKLACERQQRDYGKQLEPTYPWTYSPDKGAKVCKFLEMCPHIQGDLAGKRLKLEPWQVFVLMTVFSWLSKQTGKRRFRRVYIEIPRGNGKSFICSALCLYMLTLDGEPGAEILTAASTRQQAKKVFDIAQSQARKMPEFSARAGLEIAATSINVLSTASYFRPVSSEAGTLEGANEHFAIIDELHVHPNRKVYDALTSGLGKRSNSMLFIITTAGTDRSGVCYEVHQYVEKIVLEKDSDDRMFGIVYTCDTEDDWAEPTSLIKANPNYGISVDADDIALACHEAVQMVSKMPNFCTKRLNVWMNSDHTWMDMRKFALCADEKLTEEDFANQPCILGMDLASKLDIMSCCKIFWKDILDETTKQTKRHYYYFGKHWLPRAQIELAENASYAGWEAEGWITACPGETNDFDAVENWLREQAKHFQVLEVAHDPWRAHEIVAHMQAEGMVMLEMPQSAKEHTPAMDEMQAAVYDGRFHFDADPVLDWAVSNVVGHRDRNDNLLPVKPDAKSKIDPAVAMFMAVKRAMLQAQPANYEAFTL